MFIPIFNSNFIIGSNSLAIEYDENAALFESRNSKIFLGYISSLDINVIIKFCDEIKNEIDILLELQYEWYIIHCWNNIYSNNYVVIEYCKGGDLFEYITHNRLTETKVISIMHQLIAAIQSCHRHNIVHGDIKLENIGLLSEDLSELRLLDFGSSYKIKDINDETPRRFSSYRIYSSPHYLPPEIVNNTKVREKDLLFIDYWELGIVCYTLLMNSFPFPEFNNKPIITEFNWPRPISDKMKKFIQALCEIDPTNRRILI